MLLALGLGTLAVLWTVGDELVHASVEVGNSVPPIPAVTFLILLAAASAAARRRGKRWSLTRAELLFVYVFLTGAAAVPMVACMGYLYAIVLVPRYIAAGKYAWLADRLPTWYAPADRAAVRGFFEGHWHGEPLPWGVWAKPLLSWSICLLMLLLVLYAALALLRRTWQDQERLTYPMAQIPLALIDERPGTRGLPPFWRDPLTWLGFGLSAIFDGFNMLHAAYPAVPAPGYYYDIGGAFPDPPWNALAPCAFAWRPEIFGLAYLMPADVLLTAWASYVSLRLWSVGRAASGENVVSTSYDYQELGIGAFLGIALLLIYRAWPDLRRSWRQAWRPRPGVEQGEPLPARTAWLLFMGGSLFLVGWLILLGLGWWVALLHLGLIVVVAVVYARIRAEAGATSIYLFPFWQQQTALVNLFGSSALASGSERSLAAFASLGGLSRGVFPEISAYGAEGMGIAGYARLQQRSMAAMALGGMAFGTLLGGLLYLLAYYRYGALLVDMGGGQGGFRIRIATQQVERAAQWLRDPTLPRADLQLQMLSGGALVLAMAAARSAWLGFPFHPLGFAMAAAYGIHLWGPYLAAWISKLLIARFGGSAGHRRFMPFFLGMVLGHYLTIGLVWGLLGLVGSPVTHGYRIHFS